MVTRFNVASQVKPQRRKLASVRTRRRQFGRLSGGGGGDDGTAARTRGDDDGDFSQKLVRISTSDRMIDLYVACRSVVRRTKPGGRVGGRRTARTRRAKYRIYYVYSPTTIANVLRERQLAAGRQTTSSRRLVSVAVNARQYGTVTANSNMQRSRTGVTLCRALANSANDAI